MRQSRSSKQEVCDCVGGNCKGQGSSCIQGCQGQIAVGAACCLINRSVPIILRVFCRVRTLLEANCLVLAKQENASTAMATTMRRVGVWRCCMKVISVARGYHIYQPAGKELCLIDDRGSHVPDSMDKGYAYLQIASNWLCVTGNMGNHAPGRWRALPCLCILQILRCKL